MSARKKISILTPCYNEQENVEAMAEAIKSTMAGLPHLDYEHIFIDNASTDRTPELLRALAARDPHVKVIFNLRNFGSVRSPFYGLLQAQGDAAILMATDFQDPPEMIPKFVAEWEKGAPLVAGIKTSSLENPLMYRLRQLYYDTLAAVSEVPLLKQFTGFALYDRRLLEALRQCDDPMPYLRGLVSELGFRPVEIEFLQPRRERGKSKSDLGHLYMFAMLGFVNHSKAPLRLSVIAGFILGILSFVIAVTYLVLKLIFWNQFQLGLAPVLIGLFFFSSVQLFFLGVVGEYVGSILTQVKKRPLVIESERLNF